MKTKEQILKELGFNETDKLYFAQVMQAMQAYASQFQSGEQLYREALGKLIADLSQRADGVDVKNDYDNGIMVGLNAAANIVRQSLKTLPSPQLAWHKEEGDYTDKTLREWAAKAKWIEKHDEQNAVEFAEFICNNEWHSHRKIKPEQTTYWMNDSISGNYTTQQLYALFKQSLLSKEQNPETDK